MGTKISSASMSLDGYIAHHDNTVDPLFDWYGAGDVRVPSASPEVTFSLTPASAEHWRTFVGGLGSLIVGRTLFDFTDGWHGNHPLGVPIVVVTHEPPTDWHHPGEENFHFVSSGIQDAVAVARDLAGDRDVSVAAGTIASQVLVAGLLDLISIDLVPVVFGAGRPYFTADVGRVTLGDPTVTVASERVTHLVYPVQR